MNLSVRVGKLEAAQPPTSQVTRILISFIDPQTHEAVGMMAMAPDMQNRRFDRTPGETEAELRRRVHKTLDWPEDEQ